MIKKSNTFKCNEYAKDHRCFVISDDNHKGEHLVVNMTSVPDANLFYDKSCELNSSDEPNLIRHKSFIIYAQAFSLPSNITIEGISQISKNTLYKIQNGAKISKHLPRKFKSFFSLFS